MDVLHIYGQEYQHEDAYIVGTWAELAKLRVAVDAALMESVGRMDTVVNDGEGYALAVICVKPTATDWLAVPYWGEISRERENKVWPWELEKSLLTAAETE